VTTSNVTLAITYLFFTLSFPIHSHSMATLKLFYPPLMHRASS
jgi:hypothetical protein